MASLGFACVPNNSNCVSKMVQKDQDKFIQLENFEEIYCCEFGHIFWNDSPEKFISTNLQLLICAYQYKKQAA